MDGGWGGPFWGFETIRAVMERGGRLRNWVFWAAALFLLGVGIIGSSVILIAVGGLVMAVALNRAIRNARSARTMEWMERHVADEIEQEERDQP